MPLAHFSALAAAQIPQQPAVLPSLRQHFPMQQYASQAHYSQHYASSAYYQPNVLREASLTHQDDHLAPEADLTLSGPLRRGKWTRAEEDYAAATISYFCDGLLAIQYGTTLRGYLAQQLHCDPMRISKKLLPGSVFAGIKINPKIGRRAYYPCAQDSPAAVRSKDNAARHLTTLRRAFIQSIEEEAAQEGAGSSSSKSVKPSGKSSPSASSSAKSASIGRKRSYDDINRVVRAQQQQTYPMAVELTEPQISYHFQRLSAPALFSTRHAAVTSPVLCKLPKLTVSEDVGNRSSSTTSPVLPPLRVSLVRASMS